MDPVAIIRDLGILPAALAALSYILWNLGNKLVNGHLHFLEEMERRAKTDQEILQGIREELGNHSRAHEYILDKLGGGR